MTCAGVAYSHVRALDADEQAWLARRASEMRRRRIALGIGTALIPVLICVPLALSVVAPWAPILMLPLVWVCLMLPLKWWDARKRTAVALVSARAEEAEVFEGVSSVGAFGEASLGRLVGAGLVLDEETPQRIDRLRDSGEAISLNGARLDPPVWTDVAEVASPRSPAAEFPPLIPEFAIDAPGLDRRPLSPEEIAELRALAPGRETLRGKGCLIGLALYTLAGLTFQRFDHNEPVGFRVFVYVGRGSLLIYLGWQAYRAAREGGRIRRDLAEGTVFRILHGGKILEVLPHLGLAWTYDGEPAPWRYAVQAKTRPPV